MQSSKSVLYSDLPPLSAPQYKKLIGKTIVIKYGGAALEHQEFREPMMQDIAFLQRIGARIVIVHGGSRQLDKRMEELELPIRSVDGLRYTCASTIAEARVVFGKMNDEIVHLLWDSGMDAIGLRGEDNDLIKAELKDFGTYGYVGDVKSVDTEKLRSITKEGRIPVISALGRTDDGQLLNINADDVACAVTSSLYADEFVFITDVEGILEDPRDPASILPVIDGEGIERLLKEQVISKGMVRKVKACLDAIRNDTAVVRILSARQPRSLITEIIGESHYGTKVVKRKSHITVGR